MGGGSSKARSSRGPSSRGSTSSGASKPFTSVNPNEEPPREPEWSEAPEKDRIRGEFRSEKLQLRPIMSSDKRAWAALESLLRTKGSQLGRGRDVTESGRILPKYNELKLEAAWRGRRRRRRAVCSRSTGSK